MQSKACLESTCARKWYFLDALKECLYLGAMFADDNMFRSSGQKYLRYSISHCPLLLIV